MSYLTVVPAYGRDYKSKSAVQMDWDAGKDFLVQDYAASGYINRDDELPKGTHVMVRYNRLMKVMEVKR